jgi:uncharacterized protein YrrD
VAAAVGFIGGAVISVSTANDVDALQDDTVEYEPKYVLNIVII